MTIPFSRQLAYESGVQLNPLQSSSDGFTKAPDDQLFAIAMRSQRGRIDKPFLVDVGNFSRMLGRGESTRVNRLNEAMAQVYSALDSGAYQCLVSRLHTSAASLKYIIITENGNSFDFKLSSSLPDTPYFLALKHLECFNDGIKVSIHADSIEDDNNLPIDNEYITLTLYDSSDVKLVEYSGSLNPEAKNSYNETDYLPDTIANKTDLLIVEAGSNLKVKKSSDAYGLDANNYEKLVTSETLIYFTEGGTGYSKADYSRARDALARAKENFAYIASGGNQAVAFLSEMFGLAYDSNRQFRFDIDGSLSPDEAIAFINQFSIQKEARHLIHAYWKPVKNIDPMAVSPRYHMGGSSLNIAFSCARNAIRNANGFAKKSQAIAGKDYPLSLNGMVQTYTPDSKELSKLARAGINPIIYQEYANSGEFVFFDSITVSKEFGTNLRLINCAEMTTSLDDWITRYARECLQKPMSSAIRLMNDFLKTLFEGAESAEPAWITPSPELKDQSFQYSVIPSADNPAEKMVITYKLHYDGTNRQTEVTHTVAKA